MKNKKTQGKKNRAAGARFELKVRHDLESKGWNVSKWMNNLRWFVKDAKGKTEDYIMCTAKHKFRGKGIPMAIGTGFPDFVCFKIIKNEIEVNGEKLKLVYHSTNACSKQGSFASFPKIKYEVIGCEVKSNGYLTKEERAKCKWLLDNNIFGKILIAKKSKKRGEIIYNDFIQTNE